MKQLRLLAASVAVAALCLLLTSGWAAAASPFQSPVAAMSIRADRSVSYPGGAIDYVVTWRINSPVKRITLQEDLLHGIDLPSNATSVTSPAFPRSGVIEFSRTASSTDRKSWKLEQFVQDPAYSWPVGTYIQRFQVVVDPTVKPYKGKYVSNSVNFYIGGEWKAGAKVNTNLVSVPK